MTRFEIAPSLVTLIALESLVGIEAWLACRDRFLTATQMTGRGISHGLPFIWHFGMWGDIIVISPLAAIVVGIFWSDWSTRSLMFSLAIGLSIAISFSWSYTLSNGYDAFVQQHRLTPSGWLHLLYMSLCFCVFAQLYLFTTAASENFIKLSGILIVIHVFLGTHMMLGLLQKFVAFPWYSDHPLQSANGWAVIGVVTLLAAIRVYI